MVKKDVKLHFWLCCLYRMRTTFLLPLARMLEAFYRAIKAVNQSLLTDPWFLTCFTGSDTVVAAHCTHGFALCGLPTQSMAVWTMNTLCDNVIASLVPGCRVHGSRRVYAIAAKARETCRGGEAGESIGWRGISVAHVFP